MQSSTYFCRSSREGYCKSWGADVTMKEFSAFLDMRRYKNWAHKISSWKYLPVLPVFLRAQGASFLISTLNSFQGVLKVSSCSGTWFNPCRGRWQMPICSWHCPYGFSSAGLYATYRYWYRAGPCGAPGHKSPPVSPISLITGNRFHSASTTFSEFQRVGSNSC